MKATTSTSPLAAGILLAGVLLCMNHEVLAQRFGGFGGDRQAPHRGFLLNLNIERHAEKLGLTEEHLTAIQEERFKAKKESIQIRSEIEVAELELNRFMDAANTDRGKVTAQVERIGELRTQLNLTRVYSQLAVKTILTQEQLDKLETLRKERLKKRPKHKSSRGNLRIENSTPAEGLDLDDMRG